MWWPCCGRTAHDPAQCRTTSLVRRPAIGRDIGVDRRRPRDGGHIGPGKPRKLIRCPFPFDFSLQEGDRDGSGYATAGRPATDKWTLGTSEMGGDGIVRATFVKALGVSKPCGGRLLNSYSARCAPVFMPESEIREGRSQRDFWLL
jgi:hypothetical protein